jgi:hypothetical protein
MASSLISVLGKWELGKPMVLGEFGSLEEKMALVFSNLYTLFPGAGCSKVG